MIPYREKSENLGCRVKQLCLHTKEEPNIRNASCYDMTPLTTALNQSELISVFLIVFTKTKSDTCKLLTNGEDVSILTGICCKSFVVMKDQLSEENSLDLTIKKTNSY